MDNRQNIGADRKRVAHRDGRTGTLFRCCFMSSILEFIHYEQSIA
jgi:hypothetical protein